MKKKELKEEIKWLEALIEMQREFIGNQAVLFEKIEMDWSNFQYVSSGLGKKDIMGMYMEDYVSIGIDNDTLTLQEKSPLEKDKDEDTKAKWLPIYDKKMRDKMLSRQKKSSGK